MKKILLLALLLSAGFRVQAQYLNPTTPTESDSPAADYIQAAPLYGKTLIVIGDSYVRNHRRPIEETWHYKVAQKYRMRYLNYGKNGNCIAFDRTRRGFGEPMYTRYTQMCDTADYVLVIAGHNDAGIIADRDSTMTDEAYLHHHDSLMTLFGERLHLFIDGMIAKYPAAKLMFVSPWNVDRPGFAETLQMIRQTCAEYSIPYYDAAHESGIYVRNEAFRRRFFQGPKDTAHLNAAGHDLFMNKAETFLLGN